MEVRGYCHQSGSLQYFCVKNIYQIRLCYCLILIWINCYIFNIYNDCNAANRFCFPERNLKVMTTEDTTLFTEPLIIILLVGTCQWLYFAVCWKSSSFVLISCCSCSQGLPPFTILITWLSKTVHSYQCTYLPSALTLAWWCTFCSPALFHSLSLFEE